MTELSILIPARNEIFLARTIQDILANIEGETEVIAVVDGGEVDPNIPDDNRVTIVHNIESIGQRAATNQAAKLSKAKYIMKCDAHCSFDKGFDVKMIKEMHDDWTMVPLMRNLHVFDWVCPEGHRRYQGPSGACEKCGKETKKDILWKAKESPRSVSYCFDSTPHFQYFGEFSKRPEGQGEITETMSLQGSCWMLTREKYWELGVCDEKAGSWGSQGIEVACKTWLSGGKVMVNQKTWYAHMFRTQGGDFSFPYPISGSDQKKAQSYIRDLFFNNKWEKQIHPLSWLVEKFWPVKGWNDEDLKKIQNRTSRNIIYESSGSAENEVLKSGKTEEANELLPKRVVFSQNESPTKGIIYYTDNELKLSIARACQDQLKKISEEKNIPIVSASLKPMPHFGKNIYLPNLERGYLAYFTQILTALEYSNADVIFFSEADVFYPPSHFDFIPPKKDVYFYNQNWWRLRMKDGFCVHWDANQVSGLVTYREHALKFYKERVKMVKEQGYQKGWGFEPGRRDPILTKPWKTEIPLIDIKHGGNLSFDKWKIEHFRNKETAKNFASGWEIPHWGKGVDLVKKFS